jgi:hypothetical protein
VAAASGQAVVVVVIRAVLVPAAVVLVVKIPADGFFLVVFGATSELFTAPADWYDLRRSDGETRDMVDEGGGIASRTGNCNNANPGQTLNPFWATLTGWSRLPNKGRERIR